MTTAPTDCPPIYGQLVQELGDAVADAQETAERTQAQAEGATISGFGAARGRGAMGLQRCYLMGPRGVPIARPFR